VSRLERYIARHLLLGFALAAAVLLPLVALFDLAEQLEDVGEGSYRFLDALLHTALLAPRRLAQLTPFVGLLGGILGLGLMAAHGEMVALRAIGFPGLRLRRAVLSAATLLVLLYALLQVFAAPALEQRAITRHNMLVAGGQPGESGSALWIRNRDTIVRIGDMRYGRMPAEVEIFELRSDSRLARYLHAGVAERQDDGEWLLRDVTVKRFSAGSAGSEQRPTVRWTPPFGPARLEAASLPPGSLAPGELADYVAYLRASGSPAGDFALALWRKAGHGLLTVALVLVAVRFATGGPPRSRLAPRLILGAFTGITVYVGEQLLANTGLEWSASPVAIALLPATLLLGAGLWLAAWPR